MTVYNVLMASLIIIAVIVAVIIFLKPDPLADVEIEEEEDKFTIDYLINAVLHYVNDYQNLNVEELDMNKQNIEKIERDKEKLERAIKSCAFGDKDSKRYLKELVVQALTTQFGVTEETIDYPIRFTAHGLLSDRDKFEILLYIYIKRFDRDAMNMFIKTNKLDEPHGEGFQENYKITVDELNLTFNQHLSLINNLTYEDKLKILSQRIYSSIWGLGAVDDLADLDIDGVRAGTSGVPAPMYKYLGDVFAEESGTHPLVSFNAIWIMYKGKNLHLSFLGFGTEKEMERVCKKVYKYDNPGTLSADRGGIVNSRMDGSRVVAVRPPFADSWAFFIRKLDAGAQMEITAMFQDNGGEKAIELLHWIISGCLNLAITGEQGSGKTTMMMSLIQFIKASFTIRTQEKAFELNLKQKYPTRDIVAFRETETVSGQQGIDLQKKTDGSVNLMGEVADATEAALTIQTGQTGSNQVMFTGHMKTPPMLVKYFRDRLCEATGMTERSAESMVAEVVNCNIHQVKETNGKRHTERISVIVPHVMEDYPEDLTSAQKEYYFRQTDRPIFDSYDLLTYEDDEYKFVGELPTEMVEHICKKITSAERAEFKALCEAMHLEASAYWEARGRVYRNGHPLSEQKSQEIKEINAAKEAEAAKAAAAPTLDEEMDDAREKLNSYTEQVLQNGSHFDNGVRPAFQWASGSSDGMGAYGPRVASGPAMSINSEFYDPATGRAFRLVPVEEVSPV